LFDKAYTKYVYEERPSNSSYIQLIWRACPAVNDVYLHSASEYWGFFFKTEHGKESVSLSGPASLPRSLPYVAGGAYWGIVCKSHIFVPGVAKKDILNVNIELPMPDTKSFIFKGEKIPVPTYETAEAFIELLAQKRYVVANQLVAKALGGTRWVSKRSLQRYVLFTTGLTQRKTRRIQQARKAFALLQTGRTIVEVAAEAGYADQSHLTKSLKLLAGQTPAQILADYRNQ
jgi:AraC-like DNA-binding protein